MKFLSFSSTDGPRLGLLVDGDGVIDLTAAFAQDDSKSLSIPRHVGDLAAAGEIGLQNILRLAARAGNEVYPLSSLALLAPIPEPKKNVFCVGRNYKEHVDEGLRAQGKSTAPPPPAPEFFSKPPTAVIAAGEAVPLHSRSTGKLDYEVELAVIIGRRGRDIEIENALDHVFGYTILNDITARDLQRHHGQWFKGKGLDRSCPIGPVVVHKSALPNASDLEIRLTVNGELRQHSRTSRMIFDIPTIISQLSRGLTLEPGDVIATGTPSGVGYAMEPPRFLAAGDVINAEIEGIGTLSNHVVAD
jgi:2-keto-4-pentenoate hydratase/2-oxohepta-3-ene-1,7-dioic acid hydratase in catechol pathway